MTSTTDATVNKAIVVNVPIDEATFQINLERARDYLNTRKHLYCVDAFAGWAPE